MNEVDLTDIAQEGESNPFDKLSVEHNEQEKGTPAESSPEAKQTEAAPSQEGVKSEPKEKSEGEDNTPDVNEKLPLNKNKRWQEIRNQNEALQKRIEEMQQSHSKELTELKSLIESGQKAAKSSEPPAAFKKLFGEGQEDLWKEWQTLFPANSEVNVNELKAQLLGELEKRQAEQSEAQKRQVAWVDTELNKLKEDGLKFDKNELLSVLEQYAPTDSNGMLDFRKGYDLLELVNKTKPVNQRKDARKALAANTSPKGVSEPAVSDVIDLSKVRGRNWRDVVKY